MKRIHITALVFLTSIAAHAADDSSILWQIGKPDRNNAEFALAPDGFSKFQQDAVFVVGASDLKRDWPYVQPGPEDAWAGGRPHDFSILFGLQTAPPAGDRAE
ncbi:MAG: polysaccharide lyase family protein [Verrucomicrobia bacterium]|nr:polysaccharide lyase family protein [Verrucomicrobiota bacterium]